MSFLSSLLGNVSPFLSAVPGPIGQVAGAVGGLLSGSENRKKENAEMAKRQAIADQQAQLYQQYIPSLTNAYAHDAGYSTGADGKQVYDPNFNPYSQYADQLFDPNSLKAPSVAYQETTDAQYDKAVQAAKADTLRRGFIGNNTISDSAIGNIRTAQGADNAGFRRSLMSDLENARRQFLISGLGAKSAAQNNLTSLATSSAQGALGTLGGLEGTYANRAGGAAQGVAGLAGQIGIGGAGLGGSINSAIDWIKKQSGMGRVGTPPLSGASNGFNYNSGYA